MRVRSDRDAPASNDPAALRTHITMLTEELVQLRQAHAVLRAAADTVPDWIFAKDAEHRYVFVNAAYTTQLGLPSQAMLGKTDLDLGFPPELVMGDPARGIRGFWTDDDQVLATGQPLVNLYDPATINAIEHIFHTIKVPILDEDQRPWAVLGFARNITDLERVAQLRETQLHQDAIIAAQAAALRELSTPLIPIADGVVVMPLVGAIDSARAQQIMEALLEGIVDAHADYAILDVTGVKVVDTQVAQALLRAAQAAQLLGTRVILTGIGAEVAQTLVQLGVDFGTIVTCSNLQRGITYALTARARVGRHSSAQM